jgi:hypothetical protein
VAAHGPATYPLDVAATGDVHREFAPLIGTEAETVWAMVDFYRQTLLQKCGSLTDEQLVTRSVGASSLTLLGLLRHLTEVERFWFEECIGGRATRPVYGPAGAAFDELASVPVDMVLATYVAACERSRQVVPGRSLDATVPCAYFTKPVSIRFIAVHVIGEYARHCGHADLLREAIDGTAGL